MLEKTKGSIKNVKLWGIGNIGHKTQTEGKQTDNWKDEHEHHTKC